jgi:hypothetical protein
MLLTYRNLALTMLLGGLWHGAAWTFVVWGAFHGALLCIHRAVGPFLARVRPASGPWLLVYSIGSAFLTFHLVTVGWIFFRAKTLPEAFRMILALPHVTLTHWARELGVVGPVVLGAGLTALLYAFQFIERAAGDLLAVFRGPVPVRAAVYAGGTLLFIWVGEYGGDAFIYFQF